MEAEVSSETFVPIYKITWRQITEVSNINASLTPHYTKRMLYGQHVGFVVDKAALGQVFSENFGFPCQSFHRFLHYHNHPGLTQ
jgi:hypothetical protein